LPADEKYIAPSAVTSSTAAAMMSSWYGDSKK